MTLYHYRAIDAEGRVQTGEMEAADERAVIDQLHATGLLPVAARPNDAADGMARLPVLSPGPARGERISRRELALFTRKLATVIRAGLDLEKGLEITGGLVGAEGMRRLVARVLADLRAGRALSDALAAHKHAFPRYYVPMVRAGEASGSLGTVFARIADLMEESERLRQNVRSALIYPSVLMVTALGSIVLLMTVVIPRFEPLFRDAGRELPLITRMFMAASDAMIRQGPALLLVMLLTVLLLRWKRRDPQVRIRTDRLLLRAPLLGGLILRIEVALFTRTLGMLLQNGVPLLSGIAIVESSLSNAALAAGLGAVRTEVKNGSSLAAAMRRGEVFPDLAVQLVTVGEASGRLAEMLVETGALYDEEVRLLVQRLLALLTPVVTLGLSLLIAGIIGSVLAAILSVNDLIL